MIFKEFFKKNIFSVHTIVVFLINMLCLLFLLYGVSRYYFIKYDRCQRWIPVQDLSKLETSPVKVDSNILTQIHGNNYKDILKNMIDFVNQDYRSNTKQLLQCRDFDSIRSQDGKLTCAGLAKLYTALLQKKNIKSRFIFLVKNFGGLYDSHTTVEVFLDSKWRIFDPTFNVSFEKNGKLVGVQDITQSLHDGSFNTISPVYWGEAPYGYDLKTYYMHWLSLFNECLLYQPSLDQHSLLYRNTIGAWGKYYDGSVMYYFNHNDKPNQYMELLNSLYFCIIVIIPYTIIFSLCLLCLVLFFVYRKKIVLYVRKRLSLK